ncbi:MAG: Na/Pi cotransporter family protein [Burkholderiaceae bacterium]
MKRFLLPVAISALVFGFWLSPDFQQVAAGVAIFLLGMLMLEDGFRRLSGGYLEAALERATSSTTRSLMFGVVSTTLMQSSSLVSVITISFLSAGLISLIGGVGIIFGANIGTTTGAWLVAGFGLKTNIASYAMPMVVIGVVLVLQRSNYLKGIGYALAGISLLFLGIHYMKEGFDAFKDQIDLAQYAMTGFTGLIVYTLIGALATVVMQSSHATMVLIITALAAGQISYENAIALAIGANIGTTITAIIGSLTANYQGKRLAVAHLIFNSVTAAIALIFIDQITQSVDWVSKVVGISDTDYALKLAVFHTIFNVVGVTVMLPFLKLLIRFLEARIAAPVPDRSKPKFLSEAVDEFPQTIEAALRNEVEHLYGNAVELLAHGLNLNRVKLFGGDDVAETVKSSRGVIEFDFDERYDKRVKTLYSAIVDFSTRTGAKDLPPEVMTQVYALRDVAGQIVRAVKGVKHLRRNVVNYTASEHGAVTDIYDGLRIEVARILVEIRKLGREAPDERSNLWLDEERVQVEKAARHSTRLVDGLIRDGKLDANAATSFLNDSGYAYNAMRDLIGAARAYYIESDPSIAEVESLLALDEDEVDDVLADSPDATNEHQHN